MGFSYLPVDLKLELKKEPEGVVAAPKIDAKELSDTLEKLLESDSYSSFVGLDEETYEWTDEEKEIILRQGKALFSELEEAVLLKVLTLLEKAPRDLAIKANGGLGDEDAISKLETRIIELAKAVLEATDKETRIRGKVDKAYVEVVDFKYKQETRLAAAKALNDKTGSYEAWAKEAKEKLHESLKESVDESLNIGHFKDFKDSMLSRSLREWYLKQQAILKLLPAGKNKPEKKEE